MNASGSFLHLSTLGNLANEDLCLLAAPTDLGFQGHRPSLGIELTSALSGTPELFFDADHQGIVMSSLLGNTEGYLILSRSAGDLVMQQCEGTATIERIWCDIRDHRGRSRSDGYSLINPIGTFDCLNQAASGVKHGPDGGVVHIEKLVLDRQKATSAPALFRVTQAPTEYVMSASLADELRAAGETNLLLTELEVHG